MTIKHIIAVHSAKGGVGKSTVSVNLAIGLAHLGAKVGLLDADVHGPSISKMMGNTNWPVAGMQPESVLPLEAFGVKFISMGNLTDENTPVIWRGAMMNSALNQFFANVDWGELDYLLIDMPPGTGDAQLTLSQSVPLSGAVVVTTPQELALSDTIRGARAFQKLQVPILGLVENMSYFICDACSEKTEIFGESTINLLANELKTDILARVPLEPAICETGDAGVPHLVNAPGSETAKAFGEAARKLFEKLEKETLSAILDLSWVDMEEGERIPVPPKADFETGLEIQALWQVSRNELGISWKDGKHSIIPVRILRLACPCAVCVDEVTGDKVLDPDTVPEDLTLFQIQTVGRYAIQPVFSDGHDTGIFTFERLKQIADAGKGLQTPRS
jgi:ATP-binding protein involved in chromosome partitioning